ncbi:TPA: antitoxin Xre/MbcA/ParS toxin-binding domain-containing protein [Escherichia coli]
MLTKNDVLQKTIDLFEGNESAALNWCNEPNRALQWKTPSEIMDSEEGCLKLPCSFFE